MSRIQTPEMFVIFWGDKMLVYFLVFSPRIIIHVVLCIRPFSVYPGTWVYLVYLRVEKSRITLRRATHSAIHPIPHFAFLSYNKANDLSLWLITYTGPARWSNLSFFIAIPLFIILLSAYAGITRRRGIISLPQFIRFHLIVSRLSRQIQD